MMRCDFHLHTRYGDGKHTPFEVAAQAYADGIEILGFSEHSYLFFENYTMTPESEVAYRKDIATLKEEYRGRMTILCGLEKDIFSCENEADYDYVIGSVHYLKIAENYFGVDDSPTRTETTIKEHFGGNPYAYAEAYFSLVSRLFDFVKADIIGHFDLLTKFNEKHPVFDLSDKRYLACWKEAVEALIPFEKPFEINSGAISRGWRTTPYPASDILKFIKEKGGRIILNSDSHDKGTLRYRFDLERELALACGFTSQTVPTGNGFIEIPL